MLNMLGQHHPLWRAVDTLLFTGSEILMAVTCVGGPYLLGGTWEKSTFGIAGIRCYALVLL
jgi:hypothetical protein